jgi:hypothetical protein
LEERYPTVLGIYSFVKLRERILRHCAGATETLIDNDDKTAIVQRRNTKFTMITLVRSHGHILARYRGHGRQDGALASDGRHGIIPKYGREGET